MKSNEEVFDIVKKHLTTICTDVDPAKVTREVSMADLGATSLDIVEVVSPTDAWRAENGVEAGAPAGTWPLAFTGDGVATNSANSDVSLDGLAVAEAKAVITAWLESAGLGTGTVQFKLRD